MVFRRFVEDGLAHFSYVVGDEGTREAVILDPRRDGDVYLEWIEEEGLDLTGIVETHLHADYASGAHELAKRTGVPHYLSAYDEDQKYRARYEHVALEEGDRVPVGSLELEALHTPGHTPEHLSYLLYADQDGDVDGPLRMFSGDFLFVGSLGRPDLVGEDVKRKLASQLHDSVQKLKGMDLPGDMRIHPAHGAGSLCGAGLEEAPESTLARERAENPYFRIDDRADFVETIFDALGDYPPYYRRMKETNSRGADPVLPIDPPDALNLGDVKVAHERDDAVFLDVRPREDYGEAHVPGSLNIEGTYKLNTWAPWVVPYETPIYLVASRSADPGDLEAVYRRLLRVELDDVAGYLEGGFEAWDEAGHPTGTLEQLAPDDLADALRGGEAFVLDVRMPDEYAEARVPGALNIPVGRLGERLDELSVVPPGRTVVTVCGSGYRSSLAGSILLRNGFEGVGHLIGGFEHWRASGGEVQGAADAQAV